VQFHHYNFPEVAGNLITTAGDEKAQYKERIHTQIQQPRELLNNLLILQGSS
jgi:hypothetical protein